MKPLTGRKVFLITASAFGVILAANLTLAFNAVGSFPGLETRNSYIDSQHFDRDRAAQLALGWQVSLDHDGQQLRLSFRDQSGNPVAPKLVQTTLGRATHVKDDQTPEFVWSGADFQAPVSLAPGNWNLRLRAEAPDGTMFRQRLVLHVRS